MARVLNPLVAPRKNRDTGSCWLRVTTNHTVYPPNTQQIREIGNDFVVSFRLIKKKKPRK